MAIIKKIIHQTSWQLAAKIVTAISSLILISVITRTFGEEETGVYTLALTYLAFFYLAVDLGLNGYFLGVYNENRQLPNKLFNFRLAWSTVLVLVAFGLLPFFPFSTPPFVATVLIGGITIVLNGIFNSSNFVFQHYLAYSRSSLASIAGSVVTLFVLFLLVEFGGVIHHFAFAPLSGWVVTSLVCIFLARPFYSFAIKKPDLLFPVETLKKAWPVAATLIINTIYFRIDTFILSSSHSFADVGNYNVAYQIFQNVLVIPTFIMNGYYPLMLASMRENMSLFWNQFRIAITLMAGMGLAGGIGVYALSPFGIDILTGGDFEGAVNSLRILSFSFPAFFLSALFIWLMMAKKMYKKIFFIYVSAFLVNLILNWYFIPRYSYIAASWVTVICEYLILMLQVSILLKYRKANLPI